jgi:oligoribonuclease
MLDCEMSGLSPDTDDLLQVSAILLELDVDIQYKPIRSFNKYLHSKTVPSDDFQKKYLSEIMFECNNSAETSQSVATDLSDFLGAHVGKIQPCGDCVCTDVEFLYAKGIVTRSHFVDNKPILGTFHYEQFELNSIKALARQKVGSKFDKLLPLESGIHNALVDCRNQTQELNAFLKVLL